jgi:hypothetical protein
MTIQRYTHLPHRIISFHLLDHLLFHSRYDPKYNHENGAGCKMGVGGSHETDPTGPQTAEQLEGLDNLYRTTRDVRLRQPVQLVLLAAEKGWSRQKSVPLCD